MYVKYIYIYCLTYIKYIYEISFNTMHLHFAPQSAPAENRPFIAI